MYSNDSYTTGQVPFGGVEFAENPEPRCPCILLLDTSGSMQGAPIRELNNNTPDSFEEGPSGADKTKSDLCLIRCN
jgi:hypothetical protein